MSSGVIFNVVLCVLMIVLIIASLIYVYIDEHKKMKYYKSNLLYVTDWDKYSTMVEKQKRIIFYKKLELFWYQLLVRIKRILWN